MRLGWKSLVGTLIAFATQLAWADTQGRVSLSQASFVSPDYELTGKKDYPLFGGGLDTLSGILTEAEIEDNLQAQVRGMVAPGSSVLNYLNVSQLYWKQNLLTVGRKKIVWNQLDENFNLGSFQPQFKWNPLAWESQGLTGIFLHFENSETQIPWGVTLFGSPLFIPNQGAGYEIKDGAFQESNPYFNTPPKVAVINDREFPIDYNLQKPEVQDVVTRQSYAGRIFVGDSIKGPYLQLAYASKPMNELNLGFVNYAPPLNERVSVDILPSVSNHTLLSSDLHFANRFFKIGISALHEVAQEPKFEADWTYVKYTDSTLVSPFLDLKFKGAELNFSLLSVEGGDAVAIGPEAYQALKFIPQRYPFRDAGMVGFKYQYRFKRHESLGFATRYLRGSAGEFDLWSTQMSYQWQERWAASMTSQMVAVENNAKGERTLYNSYLNNDLVAIGVSYVF